jgi:glycosyltransferase involved in cell wall biosynthesis
MAIQSNRLNSPKRVLHLSFGNLRGGAAKGAWLLHKGLLEHGLDSHLLTTHQPDGDNLVGVDYLLKSPIALALFRIRALILRQTSRTWRGRLASSFSNGWMGTRLWSDPRVQSADIIHLHWVCGGMLSIREIGRINKPVVWTLRDMWPFTGGCHYSNGCERFKSGCGRCPILESLCFRDRSYRNFRRKERSFSTIKQLYPVGISPWIADLAMQSPVFQDRHIEWIWNGVDLAEFPYLPQSAARQSLGLDQSGHYLAMGALDWSNPYKGYSQLLNALNTLAQRKKFADIRLLVFGRSGEALVKLFPGSQQFGVVNDSATLNRIYAAADAFVAPSTEEAFGKTVVESLSSGTPVVCFDSAGPKDIVAHHLSGYKAALLSAADLAAGIEWTVNHLSQMDLPSRETWRRNCAAKAKPFSHIVCAENYINLYQRICA